MRKSGKRILCFVLSVAVSFGFGMANGKREWGLQEDSVEVQAAEKDENGFVIENGVLKRYFGEGGDVKIPNNVTNIEYSAFEGCRGLESVKIPSSVTEIRGHAFRDCKELVSIEIPNSVTMIGSDVFQGCTEDLIISCPENSYAHTYATYWGYKYFLIEGNTELRLKKKKVVLKKGQKGKVKLLSKHSSISYESKDSSIASVNSKGTVTGRKKGKTVITVTADGVTAKIKVTVKPSSANEILLNKNRKLSQKKTVLKKGTKLTIQKASGISGKVTFRSLNKTIASVSVKGVVKAKKKGKTTILIKNGSKTVKLKVTVKR